MAADSWISFKSEKEALKYLEDEGWKRTKSMSQYRGDYWKQAGFFDREVELVVRNKADVRLYFYRNR